MTYSGYLTSHRFLYTGLTVLLGIFLVYSVKVYTNLPLTGIELSYMKGGLLSRHLNHPRPHRPSTLFYSSSPEPVFTESKRITGYFDRRGSEYRERFQLAQKIRETRWVRINYRYEQADLELASIDYFTRLPILGEVLVRKVLAPETLLIMEEPERMSLRRKGENVLLKLYEKNASFQIRIDRKEVLGNALSSTKFLFIGYITLLLVIFTTLLAITAWRIVKTMGKYLRSHHTYSPAAQNDLLVENHKGASGLTHNHSRSTQHSSGNVQAYMRSILATRIRFPDRQNRQHLAWIALGLLLIVNLSRLWQNLSVPGLYFEDSNEYFSSLNAAGTLFDWELFTKHGYHTVMPIVMGGLFTVFDYGIQPFAYIVFASSLSILACMIPSLAGLFRTKGFFIAGPVILSLIGFNHVFFFTTMSYMPHAGIILLLLLLVIAEPRSWTGTLLYSLAATPLVWSGPYAVLAIPAGIVIGLLSRSNRYVLVLLAVVITQVLIGFSLIEQDTSRPDLITSLKVFDAYASSLVHNVFFFGLLDSIPAPVVRVAFFAPFLVAIAMLHDKRFIRSTLIASSIIYPGLALFYYSNKFLERQYPNAGHLEISTFFWVLLLLMAGERLYGCISRKERFAAGLVILFLTTVAVASNIKDPGRYYYRTNPEVPRYLATVRQAEQSMTDHPDAYVILRFIDWRQGLTLRIGNQDRTALPLDPSQIELGYGNKYIVTSKPAS